MEKMNNREILERIRQEQVKLTDSIRRLDIIHSSNSEISDDDLRDFAMDLVESIENQARKYRKWFEQGGHDSYEMNRRYGELKAANRIMCYEL